MDDRVPPVRLTVLHAEAYQFPSSWTFPPTVIPYSIARIVTGGTGVFTVDGEEFPVLIGDVALIPEGLTLECCSTSVNFSFISIRFTTSASIAGRDFLSEYLGLEYITTHRAENEFLHHFEELTRGWAASGAGRTFLMAGHLNLIIAGLSARGRGINPPHLMAKNVLRTPVNALDSRIESIVERLAIHPRTSPSIKALCAQAHLSESALRRLFKAQTGKTISEYHRDIRMMAAAKELFLTNRKVGEIAHSFGYHDANYFARSFHSVFGIPPTIYRRLTRQG